MNTIGKLFTFTGFGESHGKAIGGVIDGMPAGVRIDLAKVQQELDRSPRYPIARPSPRPPAPTIATKSRAVAPDSLAKYTLSSSPTPKGCLSPPPIASAIRNM